MLQLYQRPRSFFYAVKNKYGGGSDENQNYFGLHRMQAKKLQHYEGKENSSRQNGI